MRPFTQPNIEALITDAVRPRSETPTRVDPREAEIESRISALVEQVARETLALASHRQVREQIAAAIMRAPWLSSGRHIATLLRIGNRRDELLQSERIARCMNAAPHPHADAQSALQAAKPAKVVEVMEDKAARMQRDMDSAWDAARAGVDRAGDPRVSGP